MVAKVRSVVVAPLPLPANAPSAEVSPLRNPIPVPHHSSEGEWTAVNRRGSCRRVSFATAPTPSSSWWVQTVSLNSGGKSPKPMPLAGSESSALEAPSPSASHVVPLSSIFSRINGDLSDPPAPVVDPAPASVLGEADGTETTLGVDCYEESTLLADVSCTILNTMGDRASDDTSFPLPEGVDAQMWPVVSNSFPFSDGVLSSCGARERASAPCLPADDCLGALSRLCYELCSAGVDRACLIRAWWAWGRTAADFQQGRNPEDAELLALIWSLTYCAKKSWTGFEVEMDSLSIVYKLNRNELTGIKGNLIGDAIQKGSADYARGSYGMA
ncbi:hypothetical protein Cni_G26016 [Canna indica]|uniref:RNase H type-1 domain-containing protein n=1 Tax=Canna indica TaxID=4628 RepID=A0AAQ3L183_9LILI|nr:hypothetical protein Cni_G26016 [Canna indica]